MAATQVKSEKKLMEERISKVREVVHNVTNNDVVLALHNFDMDVEQTIRAFCEGFNTAIGDWEKTGSCTKKKNNKKKGKTGAQSSTSTSIAQNSKTNGLSASSISSSLSSINLVNCSSSHPSIPPAKFQLDNANGKHLGTGNFALNGFTGEIESNGGTIHTDREKTYSSVPKCHNFSSQKEQEISTSKTLDSFTRPEVSGPGAHLTKCFKEIRDALDMRERHLTSKLAQFPEMNRAITFVNDTSKIVALIAQLGEVVEKIIPNSTMDKYEHLPPQQNEEKRPNSSSSQVSSIGEDSGLGQVSPIHQAVAKANVVVQAKESGVLFESDAFSADELAQLQRNIFEQLKAKGVDPSILSDLGNDGTATYRRRPPGVGRNGTAGSGGNNREGGRPRNSNNNEKRDNKKSQRPQLELSILK